MNTETERETQVLVKETKKKKSSLLSFPVPTYYLFNLRRLKKKMFNLRGVNVSDTEVPATEPRR